MKSHQGPRLWLYSLTMKLKFIYKGFPPLWSDRMAIESDWKHIFPILFRSFSYKRSCGIAVTWILSCLKPKTYFYSIRSSFIDSFSTFVKAKLAKLLLSLSTMCFLVKTERSIHKISVSS